MKWFGPTWGAPICIPREHVEVPVGEACCICNRTIREEDQGVEIPGVEGDWPRDERIEVRLTFWHLNCFLRNLGVK